MSSGLGSGSGSQTGSKNKRTAAERSPVKVGDFIAGKYKVLEILAAGGMGVVVAAEHVQLGQRYAVKFLLADARHDQSVERFLREARAAARIESPRVCRVFDCGTLDDGSPFMVMEHLSGHDLGHELKTRGRLPVPEVVDVVLMALEGIAEAHAVGIVHRDLKPSNLFLCQKPGRPREVKVLDFGISKVMATDESTEEDLTVTAAMLGSPRYMSPEQVQNAKNVDARTDIWSLGVILYQLLDGRSPFAGTTMGETIGKVLLHVPPPIRETRSDVAPGLAQVIDRCLERDRERRYANVGELALALAPFGTGAAQASVQRISALLSSGELGTPDRAALVPRAQSDGDITALLGPAPPKVPEELTVGTVGPVTQAAALEFRPRRPTKLIVAGVIAVAGIAVVAVLALAEKGGDPPAAPAASVAPAKTEEAPAATPAPTPTPSATPTPAPSSEPVASAAPSASAPPVAIPAGKKPVKAQKGSSGKDLLDDSY